MDTTDCDDMAKAVFAATGQKPEMDRFPQAKAKSATNWTSWLPLRALSGWRPRGLNGDLIAGGTLAAIAIPKPMANLNAACAASFGVRPLGGSDTGPASHP